MVADGIHFGPAIRLTGGQASASVQEGTSQLELALDWAAMARPEGDYTVSLQLRDEQEAIVAQVDSQPRQGTYPTSQWEVGEAIRDRYSLVLPAALPEGTYALHVCMYELAKMERVPAADADGQALPRGEVELLACEVKAGQAPALHVEAPLIQVTPPQTGHERPSRGDVVDEGVVQR